jgi:hypothetical protein
MAAPEPNWYPLIRGAKPSIFFVAMRPKGEDERTEIRDMAEEAETKEADEREALCEAEEHYATGFVVGTIGSGYRQKILILTCAHIIEHVYHAVEQPIDAPTINRLYQISLCCPHSEADWIAQGGQGPRSSFLALASSIDCSRDLMLLTANVRDIALRREPLGGGPETHTVPCTEPHPELRISSFSTEFQPSHPCVLLSWPTNFMHMFYQGNQCELRLVRLISPNAAGYDMSLLEAQIGSVDGSSGGPLFNTSGEVIGVLHGGFHEYHSYFVAPHHVHQFVTTAREEAEAAAAAATAARIQEFTAAEQVWCSLQRPRSERHHHAQ